MKSLTYLFPRTVFLLIAAVALVCCSEQKKEPAKSDIIKEITKTPESVKNSETVNPYATNDQSPLDMSYYPHDYPILKMNGTDTSELIARVIYSRPQKKGREIFGTSPKSLCEYGREWRLGANEATEIEFFRDVTIAEKKISKGRYVLYCIPYPDKWTIILNTNLFTWGLHMDKTKDIFKLDIPVMEQSPSLEDCTIIFTHAVYGTDLVMAWDNVKTILPIKVTH